MDKIRLGLIGAGGIVQIHHLPLLSNYEDAEVVAICDIDRTKAGAVAQKFNVPYFYRHAEHLLARQEIDAVLVCTPNNSHMPMTLAALEAGKNVLVERPISRTLSEARRMVNAAEKAGKILMVAMNHRFRPDSLILQNFISEGELGEVFMIRSGWMKRAGAMHSSWKYDPRFSGGGVLMDLGFQMLDLCLWLMGAPKVKSVTAHTFNKILRRKVEDQVSLFLKLDEGKLITVNAGWHLPAQQTIAFTVVHGEKGTAWLNPLRIHRELHGQMMELTPGKQYTPMELYLRSFENEIRHFVESVRANKEPLSSGRDNLAVMKIVEMAYRSAKEGREITLEETSSDLNET